MPLGAAIRRAAIPAESLRVSLSDCTSADKHREHGKWEAWNRMIDRQIAPSIDYIAD